MVYPHTYRTEHSETHTTNAVYGEYYEAMKSKKIKIQPPLLTVIQYVDSNRTVFLNNLASAVQIKSIADLKHEDEVLKMIKFAEEWLRKLDMKYELFNPGFRNVNGKKVRLPPVILASLGNDPKKKTVSTYNLKKKLLYQMCDIYLNTAYIASIVIRFTFIDETKCYF